MYDLESLPKIWNLEVKQEWLVEGLIPQNAVTVLTGASGCGKSTVALLMAAAVAHGRPFLERRTKKTEVLFVDKENGLYVYTERIKRLNIEETPHINFWGIWNTECEPQGPDYPGLRLYIEKHKPLVIFDSLVAFHPGSEQDSSETRDYMDLFRKLVAIGATVLVIHHTGKSDATKEYRGSSDIPASADVCWLLTSKSPLLQHMRLHPFKSREGLLTDIELRLEGSILVELEAQFIKEDDPSWTAILALITEHPGLNQSQIISALPAIAPSRVRKVLDICVKTKKLKLTKSLLNNASCFSVC